MSALGVARRLRALSCIGYCLTDLARRLGADPSHVDALRRELTPNVVATQAHAIAQLYEQLSGWPLWGDRADRIRRNALRAGWVSPMAWEGLDIDNPMHQPDPGPADDPAESAWTAAISNGILPEPPQPRADLDRSSCASTLRRRHGTTRAAIHGCTCPDTLDAVRWVGIQEAAVVYLSTVLGWPQITIAEHLGLHPRQVQRRMRAARAAGWQPEHTDRTPLAITNPGLVQASRRAMSRRHDTVPRMPV